MAPAPLAGQVGLASPAQSLVLTATKRPSVSLALPGGSVATLPGSLVAGPNDFAPLPIETTWDLDPAQPVSVALVAFFEAPAQAFVGEGISIPSQAVLGKVSTGGPQAYSPFTGGPVSGAGGTIGVAGGTLVLFTQPVSAENARDGRSDALQIRVDLTRWPDLPAGSYRGTLNLLAVTQ
ncbi:MAG: hypothetical protein ACREMG_12545 [Gemmatimonadales bacterium]